MTGGRLGGRRLLVPRGSAVRPTTDRVRESLFARLGDLRGVRVLDLYAGSGALGIEALSRGAREAVFVERSPLALAVLRSNLTALGLGSETAVRRGDAPVVVRQLARAGERFELALLDPPYGPDEAPRVLGALAEAGVIGPGGVVVIEVSRRHPPGDVPGLGQRDERVYGDTLLVRYTSAQTDGPAAARGAGPGEGDP